VCQPVCQTYQVCVYNVCVIGGKLLISAILSRADDGELLVRTRDVPRLSVSVFNIFTFHVARDLKHGSYRLS